MLDAGCSMPDAGCSVLETRCWMLDARYSMLDGRPWSLVPAFATGRHSPRRGWQGCGGQASNLVPPTGRLPRVSRVPRAAPPSVLSVFSVVPFLSPSAFADASADRSAFICVHLRLHSPGCGFRVSGASVQSWLFGSLRSVSSAPLCCLCVRLRICANLRNLRTPSLLVRGCRTQRLIAECNMSNSARPMSNTARWPGRGKSAAAGSRGQRSAVRGQRAEVRGQRSEVSSQRSAIRAKSRGSSIEYPASCIPPPIHPSTRPLTPARVGVAMAYNPMLERNSGIPRMPTFRRKRAPAPGPSSGPPLPAVVT